MVFVFVQSCKTPAPQAVILIGGIGAVFAHTFEEACKVFVEGLQQKTAVIAHTQKGVANLFGRNIQITFAETLIQLTDIGFDVFQLFIETLGFETPTGSFFSLGIPEGGTNGEFVAELRHRAVDGDTTHDGNLIGFSDCLLRQKRTLKVLRCIIT